MLPSPVPDQAWYARASAALSARGPTPDLASRRKRTPREPTRPLRQPGRQHIDRRAADRRRMQHRVFRSRATARCVELLPRAFVRPSPPRATRAFGNVPRAPPLTPPRSPATPQVHAWSIPTIPDLTDGGAPRRVRRVRRRPRRGGRPNAAVAVASSDAGATLWVVAAGPTAGDRRRACRRGGRQARDGRGCPPRGHGRRGPPFVPMA